MDRKQLSNLLNEFLDPKSMQKILLLKGDWGVGKSYFLENFLKEWGKNSKISVGITSLFGISQFNQCLDRLHFPVPTKLSFIKNGFQQVSKLKKFLPQSIPVKFGINIDVNQIFQTVLSFILKDGVLVIDDIERKDSALPLEAVLGTASYLAEKRLRKVIIVFSERNLDNEDLIAINKLREKVVDLECCFTPTAEENVKLIFDDEKQVKILTEINITNIRLIKKIKFTWHYLTSSFTFQSDNVKQNVLRSIAVLSAIYLRKDYYGFSIEDLIDYKWIYLKDEQQKKSIENSLRELKYVFDERDLPVIDFLKTGQFDKTKWQTNIDSMEKHLQTELFRRKISEVWDFFNSNFKYNYEEVVFKFVTFLNENCELMHIRQIMEMLQLFDDIGYNYKDSYWLENCINKNIEAIALHELELIVDQIREPQTLERVKNRLSIVANKSELNTALRKVVFEHQWHQEDTIAIQNATVDDYKDLIIKSDDKFLLSFLREAYNLLLNFTEEGYKKAAKNLKAAAYQIVDESDERNKQLNYERVKLYLGAKDPN